MTFYWMSIENTLPNTLNNSCFTILNKKFYYFMRFKLYKPNRFQCVFNQNWFNKLYSFFLSNCINITCLMIIFKKNIVSCGHSLILMYYTLIWFNCKKNLKFRNGSKNDQILALRNLSTILHIEIFLMWKPISTISLTWNMNDHV